MRLLLCALLAVSAIASEPRNLLFGLSPERSVAEPSHTPGPGLQWFSALATNGEDFLAVWLDTRIPSGHVSVFASRISAEGVVLDPNGIPLGVAQNAFVPPDVVWLETHYLVVWKGESKKALAMRVRSDGSLVDEEPLALTPSNFLHHAFTSNGDRSLLVSSDQYGNLQGTVLNQDLSVRGEIVQLSDGREGIMADGAGDVFMLVLGGYSAPQHCDAGFCTSILRISLDGQFLGRSSIPLQPENAFSEPSMTLGSDGESRFILAYAHPATRALQLVPITASGEVGNTVAVSAAGPATFGFFADAPSVSWNDSGFTVAWSAANQHLHRGIWLVGMDPELRVMQQPQQMTQSSTLEVVPKIAHAGGRLLGIWQQQAIPQYGSGIAGWDVVGKVLTPGDASQWGVFLVTQSSIPQDNVTVASTRSVHAALWTDMMETENKRVLRVARISGDRQNIDGPGIEVETFTGPFYQRPSPSLIGSDAESFLLLWKPTGRNWIARRLGTDGQWIDAAPRDTALNSCGSQDALLWNGQNYFFVFMGCSDPFPGIFGVHLDRTGLPVGSPTRISDLDEGAYAPAVAFDGENYLVAWSRGRLDYCGFDPCPPPMMEIRAARVRRDSTVLDPLSIVLANWNVITGRPSVAWGGGTYLVTWSTQHSVRGTRVSPQAVMLDGTIESQGVEITRTSVESPPSSVLWNGQRFVVLWRDRSSLRTNSINVTEVRPDHPLFAHNRVIESISREFAGASVNTSGPPAGVLTPEGVVLAYTRIAPEPAFGGTKRIFARVLKPRMPRGRGARR